jgi:hypothetical protein
MFQFKRLSKSAIPAALEKVEHYRLLNDPFAAESICRDVLAADPRNQLAAVNLILCLCDQLFQDLPERLNEAQELASRLESPYARAYYTGIVCERCAKAQHRHGTPGAGAVAYEWLRKAMQWYEKAEQLRPAGNDDSILRWNTCARLIMGHRDLRPGDVDAGRQEIE